MPLNIDFVQVLLHMLNFAILFGGLTLLLYKPIMKFMTDRKEYYEKQEAETARKVAEAEQAKAEYEARLSSMREELQRMVQEEERKMASTANAYLEKAQGKADAIIAEAEKTAKEHKAHILDSAQSDFSELVLEAAAKLVSDTSTPEREQAIYDAFLRATKENAGTEGAGK